MLIYITKNSFSTFMPLEYTHSPLGLVPYSKITNPESQTQFKFYYNPNQIRDVDGSGNVGSVFSNKSTLVRYADGGKKHFGTHPLAFGKVEDTHNDSIYDISTKNIIERLNEYPSMRLKWGDFAYCRDYGVYPNNRLIICRRFPAPVTDDLTFNENGAHVRPISTLVTWFDDQSPPLEFNFGEEWDESGASFKELLNEVGKDLGMKSIQLGDTLYGASNLIPLPGASEGLQRQLLGALGFIKEKDIQSIIPSGTPNLIKESKKRKTIKEDYTGSSLKGSFTIKVKCSWEQKFIAGIDPTLVYYDILQTILAFGGSEAVFYLGKKSSLGKLDTVLQDYLKPGGAAKFVKKILTSFKDALLKLQKKITEAIKEAIDSSSGEQNQSQGFLSGFVDQVTGLFRPSPAAIEAQANTNAAVSATLTIINSFAETVIKKYRVQALGIVTSLTGLPATPWHVTIGNPLRPFFSSGDMLTTDVQVSLGPQLSFNDLPSYIEATFTLVNQRNVGIDEIMTKLSCGAVRVSQEAPSFWNKNTQVNYNEEEESNVDSDPQNLLPVVDGTLTVDQRGFKAYEEDLSTVDSAQNKEEDIKNQSPTSASESLASGTAPGGGVGSTASTGSADDTSEFPNLLPEFVIEAQRSPANSGQGASQVQQSKVGAEPAATGQVTNPSPFLGPIGGGTGGANPTQFSNEFQGPFSPEYLSANSTVNTTPTTTSAVRNDIKAGDGKGGENVTGSAGRKTWEFGKKVKAGGYSQNSIDVKWQVRQGQEPNTYFGVVSGEEIGVEGNNLEAVTLTTKEYAKEEFTQLGGVIS
jgi:hypothetical protein